VRARRVDEGDERVFGAWAGPFVDQFRAACLELRERGVNVVDSQRNVVQPGTALLRVLRDRRIGRGGFEQFELGLANRQKMRADALRRHIFGRLDLEAQRIAIERERRTEIFDGDADVIEDGLHAAAVVTTDR